MVSGGGMWGGWVVVFLRMMCAGMWTQFFPSRYTTRWELKGWNEEAYEARFRMARVSRHLKYSWPATQQMYLSAHSYLPKRIEPVRRPIEFFLIFCIRVDFFPKTFCCCNVLKFSSFIVLLNGKTTVVRNWSLLLPRTVAT